MTRLNAILIATCLAGMATVSGYSIGAQARATELAADNEEWFRAGVENAIQNIAIGGCSHLDGFDQSDCLTRLYKVSERLYAKGAEATGE